MTYIINYYKNKHKKKYTFNFAYIFQKLSGQC